MGSGSISQTRFVFLYFKLESLRYNKWKPVNIDPFGKSPFQFPVSLKFTATVQRGTASPQAQSCIRLKMQISETIGMLADVEQKHKVTRHHPEEQSVKVKDSWGIWGEFHRWFTLTENRKQQRWLLQEGWRLDTTGRENICDWDDCGASPVAKE